MVTGSASTSTLTGAGSTSVSAAGAISASTSAVAVVGATSASASATADTGSTSVAAGSAFAAASAAARFEAEPWGGTVWVGFGLGAEALSKASATRSVARPLSPERVRGDAGAGTETFAADAVSTAGAVSATGSSTATDSDSVGRVRSVWGGTVAVVGSSCSVRSRPNTLRSKLRMPMGEAFRMS